MLFKKEINSAQRRIKFINGFSTAFAVLHPVTLTIKDGSLHGSDHLVQSRGDERYLGLHSKLLRDNIVVSARRSRFMMIKIIDIRTQFFGQPIGSYAVL